jgi:hypothetical protein
MFRRFSLLADHRDQLLAELDGGREGSEPFR